MKEKHVECSCKYKNKGILKNLKSISAIHETFVNEIEATSLDICEDTRRPKNDGQSESIGGQRFSLIIGFILFNKDIFTSEGINKDCIRKKLEDFSKEHWTEKKEKNNEYLDLEKVCGNKIKLYEIKSSFEYYTFEEAKKKGKSEFYKAAIGNFLDKPKNLSRYIAERHQGVIKYEYCLFINLHNSDDLKSSFEDRLKNNNTINTDVCESEMLFACEIYKEIYEKANEGRSQKNLENSFNDNMKITFSKDDTVSPFGGEKMPNDHYDNSTQWSYDNNNIYLLLVRISKFPEIFNFNDENKFANLFDENVRGKQENKTFKEIQKSLKYKSKIFHLMNNGIMIAADAIEIANTHQTLAAPKVINGLQTLSAVRELWKNINENEFKENQSKIIVKIIDKSKLTKEARDDQIFEIIKATNTNTKIKDIELEKSNYKDIYIKLENMLRKIKIHLPYQSIKGKSDKEKYDVAELAHKDFYKFLYLREDQVNIAFDKAEKKNNWKDKFDKMSNMESEELNKLLDNFTKILLKLIGVYNFINKNKNKQIKWKKLIREMSSQTEKNIKTFLKEENNEFSQNIEAALSKMIPILTIWFFNRFKYEINDFSSFEDYTKKFYCEFKPIFEEFAKDIQNNKDANNFLKTILTKDKVEEIYSQANKNSSSQ